MSGAFYAFSIFRVVLSALNSTNPRRWKRNCSWKGRALKWAERCSAPARHEKRTTRRNKSAPLEVKIFLEGKGTEMGGTMFRTGSLRKANNPPEQSEPLVQKEIPVD